MPQPVSPERLAQAAFWYYVQDLGQAEVARRLNTSRSNVSRLLRSAREKGIIRFEIVHPIQRDLLLEERLRARFGQDGVDEFIVAATSGEYFDAPSQETGMLAVARSAADWLGSKLLDGQTLGLFWGSTVRTVVDVARFEHRIDTHVVQLGGEWSDEPNRSGHNLVRDLAMKLGGRYTYFNAPAFAATAADAEALLSEPQVARSLDAARSADVCLVGVGAFPEGTTALFIERAHATTAEIEEAERANVVGQLAGRFFDAEGRQADIGLHRRLISLDLTEVRGVTTVAVAASGIGKAKAVRSAMRGKMVDVLICDQALATALLEVGDGAPT
ncbi:sugar-binding transcriptional regulator [Kineococcus aurantiacus]|uniref:DNA-binding transcriptional regulator LsrR (DeoR family) n=1 Tax=Kineococcus aurantiacus TaxID=37633 RepID=A0A7Y9DQX4_9ACTN|nr:sugar-binding domain-containing protein [Kineococcus aurantiacus]NYD25097.1 DNA-binding transcriptional regulator LsrR (DeoR family) [Kineococcus aurantiacus]